MIFILVFYHIYTHEQNGFYVHRSDSVSDNDDNWPGDHRGAPTAGGMRVLRPDTNKDSGCECQTSATFYMSLYIFVLID